MLFVSGCHRPQPRHYMLVTETLLSLSKCRSEKNSKAPSTPATMSKQHSQMLQVEGFFRQSRMSLRHCCRFWQQCQTKFRPFDKVETNWTCSICFDFVKRTKFHEKLVRHCCHFFAPKSIVASTLLPAVSTLLLVWTELKELIDEKYNQ